MCGSDPSLLAVLLHDIIFESSANHGQEKKNDPDDTSHVHWRVFQSHLKNEVQDDLKTAKHVGLTWADKSAIEHTFSREIVSPKLVALTTTHLTATVYEILPHRPRMMMRIT